MTLRSLLLWFGTLACSPAYGAERVAAELGAGIHNLPGARGVLLHYADDVQLPDIQPLGFYEFTVGGWDGRNHSNAAGFALGLQTRWDNFHVDASAGVGYLTRKTELSGTHQQFTVRLGAGYTAGKFDFSISRLHISNAKIVFGWDGPNAGYDFITFQVAYALK